MKRIICITILIALITNSFSQTDWPNSAYARPMQTKTTVYANPQVLINDYAYMVDEDCSYLFEIDFVRKIKNAYYIGAHTLISDTIVYVKILEPVEPNGFNNKGIIRVGNSYKMRLTRYFPYPLAHPFEDYVNYNLLFGKKLVCLQSTDCLTYIFSTDNLDGLQYSEREYAGTDTKPYDEDSNPQYENIAGNALISILQKDVSALRQLVDSSAIIKCAKNQSKTYSALNLRRIRCIPPFRLQTVRHKFNRETKGQNLSGKLHYMLTDTYFPLTFSTPPLDFHNFMRKIDVVYDRGKYVTCRILWTPRGLCDSLPNRRIEFCTYFSFKKNSNGLKLIGLCSSSVLCN